jgi:hypothetical protein
MLAWLGWVCQVYNPERDYSVRLKKSFPYGLKGWQAHEPWRATCAPESPFDTPFASKRTIAPQPLLRPPIRPWPPIRGLLRAPFSVNTFNTDQAPWAIRHAVTESSYQAPMTVVCTCAELGFAGR